MTPGLRSDAHVRVRLSRYRCGVRCARVAALVYLRMDKVWCAGAEFAQDIPLCA